MPRVISNSNTSDLAVWSWIGPNEARCLICPDGKIFKNYHFREHERSKNHTYHLKRVSTGTQLPTPAPATQGANQIAVDDSDLMEIDHQAHDFLSADELNPIIDIHLCAATSETEDIDPDLLTQHWAQMTQPERISFGPDMDPIDLFEEVTEISQPPMLHGQLFQTTEELPQDHPSLFPNSDEDAEGSVDGEADAEGSTDEEDAEGSIYEEDAEGPRDEQTSGVQVDSQDTGSTGASDTQTRTQAESNPTSTTRQTSTKPPPRPQPSRQKKTNAIPRSAPYYPWASLAIYLTDVLFSSPHLHFSEAQKAAIIAWAKSLGANVPSLYAIKKSQAEIREEVGLPTEKFVSPVGNVFYFNSIAHAISKDYSNPLSRSTMQDYPELAGKGMSQVFHGQKMTKDAPEDVLPPMVRNGGKNFYVDEVLQRKSGAFFVPKRFLYATRRDQRELYALGYDVFEHELKLDIAKKLVLTPVSTFLRPLPDLNLTKDHFTESSQEHKAWEHHSVRAIAGDRMAYAVPLIVFMDDVSGNISKQWNKHFVIYLSNASMPRETLDKQFFVRFFTSSPNASPTELMHALKYSMSEARKTGVKAWDCVSQEEVVLLPYVIFFPGDNPMQAEECSHAGLQCNHPCRTCHVGGTKEYKSSDSGYLELFKPGKQRTPEETKNTIKESLDLCIRSGAADKIKKLVSLTGISDPLVAPMADSVATLGRQFRRPKEGVPRTKEEDVVSALMKELQQLLENDPNNPLLDLPGVDINRDTPTEILHTILLGVVKYFWSQTIWLINKTKTMSTFQMRLASLNHEGLNIPKISADYMCRYAGGLNGKHFKTIAQVMPFVVHGLVPKTVLNAWSVIGELVVLLWHTEIPSIPEYTKKLSTVIDNFLNLTALCAPSIIISKPKFHFLTHLPDFILRFGPALLLSTERYESFNKVYRATSIFSNHMSPSRDSCLAFASQDIVKHLTTGGYWFSATHGAWVRASSEVMQVMTDRPEFARLLGIPQNVSQSKKSGHVRLPAGVNGKIAKAKAPKPFPWAQTKAAKVLGSISISTPQAPRQFAADDTFWQAISIAASTGDTVRVGSHIIYDPCLSEAAGISVPIQSSTLSSSANNITYSVGRVLEILVPNRSKISGSSGPSPIFISVEMMGFLGKRHTVLDLPCVELTGKETVICPESIICTVNLQHDCHTSKCAGTKPEYLKQERILTSVSRMLVDHQPTSLFVVNTHSLHNYQYIQKTIPAHLSTSSLDLGDTETLRRQAAQQIRNSKKQKDDEIVFDPEEMGKLVDAGNPVLVEAEDMPAAPTPIFQAKKATRGRASNRGTGRGRVGARGRGRGQGGRGETILLDAMPAQPQPGNPSPMTVPAPVTSILSVDGNRDGLASSLFSGPSNHDLVEYPRSQQYPQQSSHITIPSPALLPSYYPHPSHHVSGFQGFAHPAGMYHNSHYHQQELEIHHQAYGLQHSLPQDLLDAQHTQGINIHFPQSTPSMSADPYDPRFQGSSSHRSHIQLEPYSQQAIGPTNHWQLDEHYNHYDTGPSNPDNTGRLHPYNNNYNSGSHL